jgi:hypothetical protein
MQNAAGGAPVEPGSRDDGYQSIVSDLVSLIGHVQASLTLIESAVAREKSFGNHDGNVVVLDDVAPRYLEAGAALKACDAGLGAALQFLLDTRALDARTSQRGTVEFAGYDRRPARLIART